MSEQDLREKVIKGLEVCKRYETFRCENCPYDSVCRGYASELMADALTLLKAQEPVKPKKNYVQITGLKTWDWACPECNCILVYRANYCSCCGRAVKWE